MNAIVEESRRHLGDLIEACQRCAWHLNATAARIEWPVTATALSQRQMDLAMFEPLAAKASSRRSSRRGIAKRAASPFLLQ